MCCSNTQCSQYYHIMCAKTNGCNLREGREAFFCRDHDGEPESSTLGNSLDRTKLQSAGFCPTKNDVFAQIDGFKIESSVPLGVAAVLPFMEAFDVLIKRVSFADAWPIQFHAIKDHESPKRYLSVAGEGYNLEPELKSGDFLISINSRQLGVDTLRSLDSLISFLNAHTQIKITVGRRRE